jgi:hypothetical protein
VRTLPLLTTGMSTPSTRVFTTERSAAPCRLRRADEWRACKARKDAPDAWRVLASVSVDDTGLQRRNLAETGTHNECEREETVWHIKHRTFFDIHPVVLLTDALNEGPVFLSEQVRPEVFFSSDVLRTTKVQICVTSQERKIASESRAGFTKDEIVFSKRVESYIPIPSQRSTTVFAPRTITS